MNKAKRATKRSSRRYDALIQFWTRRLEDERTTADEKLEAARRLEAVLIQSDRVSLQRAGLAAIHKPGIATAPAPTLQETIESLRADMAKRAQETQETQEIEETA